MKKISILSVSVLLCIISVFTSNAYYPSAYYKNAEINGVDFKYRVIENKSVEIIKGEGFIPDEIEGYPVTIIGDRAYHSDVVGSFSILVVLKSAIFELTLHLLCQQHRFR